MSAGKEFWMDGDAVQKAQFSASMSNDYYAVCRTCICNCLHHTVCLRPNSIMLSSSRTSSRAGLRPASKLDSVMEFHLSGTVSSLACRSQVCNLVVDLVSDLSQTGSSYLEIARTWSLELVCPLLAGHKPAGEPAPKLVRQLDSVMAFGLYMTVMRVQVCAVERS